MDRVLLIHGGALGDFVLTLRIVDGLRRAGARCIHVLGREVSARWAANFGLINGFRDLESGGFHSMFTRGNPLPESVREFLTQFDLVIDTLGVNLAQIRDGTRIVSVDPRPHPGIVRHITEQWLSDLHSAGVSCLPGPPGFKAPANLRPSASQLRKASNPITVIHPGSGSPRKCWPPDRFLEVIDLIHENGGACACLLGPVEADRNDLQNIVARADTAIRPPTIESLLDVLINCDLYVGNDSGVSQLAGAAGIRCVVIFGPTSPGVWRPLGPHVAIPDYATGAWPTVDQVCRCIENAFDAGPAQTIP